MIQNILAALVILAALAWFGRRLYLILRGKSAPCSGCAMRPGSSCRKAEGGEA